MDRGAWQAEVHGVARSQTRLRDFTFTFHFYALEKEMATHSSVPAWSIPGTGEPGGLPSLGSHRVRHDWTDLAAIFHCVYIPHLSYPFICWWTSKLLPCSGYYSICAAEASTCSGYYKQWHNEHWGTCVSFNSDFLSVYAQQWDCWVIEFLRVLEIWCF